MLLIPVKSNQEKLIKIVETAKNHFDQEKPLTLLVESQAAVEYIDKLLWATPIDGFLPHSGELITITDKRPKDSLQIFNLTSKALIDQRSGVIYEFDDQSSEHKQETFKARYNAYKKANFRVALH